MRARLATIAAIAFVVLVYVYFGSLGDFAYSRVQWDDLDPLGKPAEGYYASLSEGFLRGQTNMAHAADPKLIALPDPYDYETRKTQGVPYLWDASYLNGKYYLYFTPLPALLLYIPYRFLAFGYPHDQLAGTLFALWTFLMSAAFVRRALANRATRVPMPLWMVFLGLSGVAPYVLGYSRTYEVAIFCGAAMTATWTYSMLRFMEAPTTRRLVWTSVWLALAIAARPNLAVLLVVFFVAIAMKVNRAELWRSLLVAGVPLAITAVGLLAYNYARFRNPLEFGTRYQLTYMSMFDRPVCGIHNQAEVARFFNSARLYLFQRPWFEETFPFVNITFSEVDPRVSFGDMSDPVAGLFYFAPLAVLGTLCALLLLRRIDDVEVRAAQLSIAAGWLALFGLCTCWYVSARYEVNFWFLISAGAVVCIEAWLRRVRAPRAYVVTIALLVIFGTVIATMSAFHGMNDGFMRWAPDEFEKGSRFFSRVNAP